MARARPTLFRIPPDKADVGLSPEPTKLTISNAFSTFFRISSSFKSVK
ncbi:MAG: Uncharacterised protein [Rhodothermaeota bacterium MED-G12]|nr:MAG: Uncharacterised protein [Rhodothermaeota bacterium MED-G12]